ncbi:hypothetical protein DH2020_045191 [Rehmannia glutinosa]|uniref:Uncharacterized protein n=1 Tax=Rehmannia glutinosa TaxID=99300 RepID=A0ABR0UFJ3_REHGL
MEEELEIPATATAGEYSDDIDSCCSTPYVSAPSSPGRGTPLAGFYYSAPTSPTHFVISTTNLKSYTSAAAAAAASDASSSFEFDFSATFPSTGASSPESMTSADELFCNGQIRPMKLSSHLQRPQLLAPLIESDDVVEEDQTFSRGRELKLRAGSLRRRTDPCRLSERPRRPRENAEIFEEEKGGSNETTPCASRSSSAGRSSRRWVFLKEFLYRSKSEGQGRNEGHKFWGSLSFSPVKDKKTLTPALSSNPKAEEMRKKTFLPYRQGLLGCLGFSSKSYGAINGFARALNPVSSR